MIKPTARGLAMRYSKGTTDIEPVAHREESIFLCSLGSWPARSLPISRQSWQHPSEPRQMNVTARSSKDEIITAAMELTDSQDRCIRRLEQQQAVLLVLLGIATVWALL